jgi:prepilin-type N-terminal cleavage/methylation domain-containing protein/prepilin-type processing-associated H-X9-DG protein
MRIHRGMARCLSKRGVSLIEVLVVIGIIGILAGLLLPAVQAAREAARRAACASHLKQIGLAIQAYHEANGCFPVSWTGRRFSPDWAYEGFYSPLARLLPYIEQRPLYDAINFDTGTAPVDVPFSPTSSWAPELRMNVFNQTAISTKLALFLCPSDGGPFAEAGTNYRGNAGVGYSVKTGITRPDSGNGLFPEWVCVSARMVTDGLSHTAAFSERLRGSGRADRPVPHRDSLNLEGTPFTADLLVKSCRMASTGPFRNVGFPYNGRWWFWSGRERTQYNHAQPPNGPVPDCLWGGAMTSVGMATARSAHPSGVNVVMGDGSVRFASNATEVHVWRALGTRNGREIVEH